MASSIDYPARFLTATNQSTKNLSVVITIEGLGDTLSIVPIYTKIRYGDPGIFYGEPGLVYGGLRVLANNKPYLQVDGLTIQQKIEPEQGKGSVSLMTLMFIDKDQYLSQLISPGILIPEILGRPLITVYLGYVQSSFPEDYIPQFRGYISGTTSGPGWVSLQLSDSNIKRYGQVFYINQTTLTSFIDNVQTNIPVTKTDGFFQQILGPDSTYDPAVTTYITVESEVMTYPPTGISGPTTFTVLSRGGSNSRGTLPQQHDINSTVVNSVQIEDNAITLALKVMLSGWNGPYITGVPCQALGTTLDIALDPAPSAIVLAQFTDASVDLGLVIGDYVIISGSTAGNDGTHRILSFGDQGGFTNNVIYLVDDLNYEAPASTVNLAFRSQFDTLPVDCGAKLSPREVDVQGHLDARRLFFSAGSYTLQMYFQQPVRAKDMIESECYLPIGAYSLTRYGRLSVGVTKPPISDQKAVVLNARNIIDPDKISVTRALNTRRFYNEIQYSLDQADDGTFQDVQAVIDTDSATKVDVLSVLPIASAGLRSEFGGDQVALSRGRFLLNRFKNGAFEINCKVMWQVGVLIEVGDVVSLQDDGLLQITNFQTGKRDLKTQLFEVIQVQKDVKNGIVSVTLLSQLYYTINQRFGVISPSSLISTARPSTTTEIQIQDSFGALYPGNEQKKWTRIIGNQIRVHSYDYSVSDTVTLLGFDPMDRYRMLTTPLAFAPPAGYIVDVAPYDTGTNPQVNSVSKLLYDFVSPTLTVVTGISPTSFTLSAPDAARIVVNQFVAVRNSDWSALGSSDTFSPESKVLSVIGTTVTVETALGFTPTAGQKVEYVGFKDGGGSYRVL